MKPKLKIHKDGTKSWTLNGKLHREDGPAIIYKKGTKCLYHFDEHTIESSDGYRCWYFNGKRHRIDGPAMESSSGDEYWFLNGKEVNKEDVIINAILTEKEYIEFILKRLL